MNAKRYSIVIERSNAGFSAWSPDVAGCCAVGDTEEETTRNLRYALTDHLRVMRQIGDEIPEPSSSVTYVDVAA